MSTQLCATCGHIRYGKGRGNGHFGGDFSCKDQNCVCGAYNKDHKAAGNTFTPCDRCGEKTFHMRHWHEDRRIHVETRKAVCPDGEMPQSGVPIHD